MKFRGHLHMAGSYAFASRPLLIGLLLRLVLLAGPTAWARDLHPVLMASALDSGCQGTSWQASLPAGFEPSDVAWHPGTGLLYVVGDEGRLAALHPGNGSLHSLWDVPGAPDLEGITFRLPGGRDEDGEGKGRRQPIVYLAQEAPAAILQFDLDTSRITGRWELQAALDTIPLRSASSGSSEPDHARLRPRKKGGHKAGYLPVLHGIEALTYVPPVEGASDPDGLFLVGRQVDGLVAAFALPSALGTASRPRLVATLHVEDDGTGGADLAALTIAHGRLWLLYDKPRALSALRLDALRAVLPVTGTSIQSSTPSLTQHLRADARSLGTLSLPLRGGEGIAFVPASGPGHPELVVLAVDPPRKSSRKDLLVFPVRTFLTCFSSLGAAAALE